MKKIIDLRTINIKTIIEYGVNKLARLVIGELDYADATNFFLKICSIEDPDFENDCSEEHEPSRVIKVPSCLQITRWST